jgi:hypothetical protein
VASDGTVTAEGVRKVFLPKTSNFTPQVISLTFATASGGYFWGTVTMNGKTVPWQAHHNTDLDTTCTGIAAAINTAVDTLGPTGQTVIAASVGSGGGVVTLTAEVEGAEFEANANASGSSSATAAKAYTTGPSISTSLRRAMVGISVRRMDVENQSANSDDPAYPGGRNLEVCTRGAGWVQRSTSETWSPGDELWVSLASDTAGRLYNAAGTDRVWLGTGREIVVERSERSTDSNGIGRIRLDMGA